MVRTVDLWDGGNEAAHKTPINMGRMQFFGNFDGKKENYCIFFYRIWLKKAIFEGMLRQ